MCYLYFFCLHCCFINIHILDYPDSRLSGLFTEVPTSPDNRGPTVCILLTCFFCCLYIIIQKIALQVESETCFQICFFPPNFAGGGVLSMRMQVILDSLFARPGSAGRKETPGTGLPCIVTIFLSFYRLEKGSLQLFSCLEWQEAWLAEWFIFRG